MMTQRRLWPMTPEQLEERKQAHRDFLAAREVDETAALMVDALMPRRKAKLKRRPKRERDPRQLTPRQATALAWIRRYIAEHGYPPTQLEAGLGLGVSQSAAGRYVYALVRAGYLRAGKGGKQRSISLVEEEPGGG